MDTFLETHKLLKLTQEATENPNMPYNKRLNVPQKESPGPDGFVGKPYEMLKN